MEVQVAAACYLFSGTRGIGCSPQPLHFPSSYQSKHKGKAHNAASSIDMISWFMSSGGLGVMSMANMQLRPSRLAVSKAYMNVIIV